jgi:4-carboxymuconolactone decarboxylase
MSSSEWSNRDDRQADAKAEYEKIMTTGSPDPTGAYIDAGVIGFVFGEMWRRGVLTPRDRRFITLSCVGAMGADIPIETHSWAAVNSGDLSIEEFDEFVLHFGTQLGWPKASAMNMQMMVSAFKHAEQAGRQPQPLDFEPWVDPEDDDVRRARGEAAYREVHGQDAPPAETAFRGRGYLDYLYGEIWTRDRYLSRRDRRIISICCCGTVGVDRETREHLRAAMATGDMTFEELQELVFHYAIYVGWPLGRHLDDLLVEAAAEAGVLDA